MPSNGLWLSESVWFTAHPTSTPITTSIVINRIGGQCRAMGFGLVNRSGSLPTLHQLPLPITYPRIFLRNFIVIK
ncbi:MAG: hypothetical protein F6K55_14505 [Moorea sp. SIO4A3]|nr:hypothetical protein [Moorena sp. SIO4A3]